MDIMRFRALTGLTVVLLTVAATQAHAQNRFQGMDRNRDGKISRDEWRGNDTSFDNQDWDGNGVLSGDEIRPGARKPAYDATRDWNHDGVINQQDAIIGQRFSSFDRNGDGRITQDEWRAASADNGLFYRLDANRDRALTMAEYAASSGVAPVPAPGAAEYRFVNIDRNRDGWITRNEWGLGDADFNRLDRNRDNRLSTDEFQAYSNTNVPSQPNARFTAMDTNRDGAITWNEWRGTEGDYVLRDTNGDARLSPAELDANPTATTRFSALDSNRDGWLARNEWKWSDGSFYRMDMNSDNRLSRTEFQSGLANTTNRVQADDENVNRDDRWNNGRPYNGGQTVQRTRGAQAGYDRGLSEGQQAGREDRANGHGWDLDGQTELEGANSGYTSQLGTLTEYQGGYREGFRVGYREGYGR
jgi:Ca2+-binding EF-hand superfamily protein